jgi:hypothetical protein
MSVLCYYKNSIKFNSCLYNKNVCTLLLQQFNSIFVYITSISVLCYYNNSIQLNSCLYNKNVCFCPFMPLSSSSIFSTQQSSLSLRHAWLWAPDMHTAAMHMQCKCNWVRILSAQTVTSHYTEAIKPNPINMNMWEGGHWTKTTLNQIPAPLLRGQKHDVCDGKNILETEWTNSVLIV